MKKTNHRYERAFLIRVDAVSQPFEPINSVKGGRVRFGDVQEVFEVSLFVPG